MPAIDLATFKPQSAGELAQGIFGQLLEVLGNSWIEAKSEIGDDLDAYSSSVFRTIERLANGEISEKKADVLLHMQELFLNQILLNVEFWTYVVAQRALDAVAAVISAAVRNLTGFQLNF